MNRLLHIISICTALCICAACNKEASIPPCSEDDGKLIEVPLSLIADGMDYMGDTKATSPYIPDYENLIHDIWVTQYSSRGVLLSSTVKHYRPNGPGQTKVTDLMVTLRESAEDCTVCLLVNAGNDPLQGAVWPDNLETYKETMIPVSMLTTAEGGKKMPMNGFYQGPVPPKDYSDNDGSSGGYKGGLNVSLGRMMCRLNIVFNNHLMPDGDTDYTTITGLNVKLDNVPGKAHLLPTINYTMPDKSILGKEEESVAVTLEKGESTTLYYYMAPNLYRYDGGTDMRTRLTVTAAIQGLGERSGTLILGNDSPETADRDYRLYPNNNYTFTINLRNDL